MSDSYRDECAHQFHALGCVVLPLHYPVAGHCSCRAVATCGSAAKHPAVAWRATHEQSREELATMLTSYRRHNLGVKLTGTGLCVLDVDPAGAGDDALRELEAERGERLLGTLTVMTAAGARHMYYRMPAGWKTPPHVVRWMHGVDVRFDGVMVIPPSVGMTLREYTFAADSHTVPAVLPDDIAARIAAVPVQPVRERRPHRTLHAPRGQDRVLR